MNIKPPQKFSDDGQKKLCRGPNVESPIWHPTTAQLAR